MQSLLRLCVVLLIVAAVSPAGADGELRSARFLPAIDALSPIFEEIAGRDNVPGISVAVAFENRLVWTQGFGFADIEKQIPMSPKSKLRVGSIAKVMTAAALARLVERGEIDLDAEPYTVVGIMPPGFEFPTSTSVELWTPLAFDPNDVHGRSRSLTLVGRMTSGTTAEQSQGEMTVLAAPS